MTKRRSISLGRHLLPAVVMTSAASGLVALLDQPSSGSAGNVGGSGVALPNAGGATVASQPPAVSSTLPPAAQPTPEVVPSTPAPQQQPATTTPKASNGSCQGQTLDGQAIDTRWGPVQVEAVVSSSGQICDIKALQSPDSHSRSVQINDIALPMLHDQVMQAQSVNINGVSGATITSIGYDRSLQSILDKLGR